MSLLVDLIRDHCPDGVTYRSLDELGSFYGGLSGKTKADFSGGNARFVTYMNVFAHAVTNIRPVETVRVGAGEKQNRVLAGDVLFTASSENLDEVGMASVVTTEPPEPLYLNSFCFGFRPHADEFEPAFSKHLFRSVEVRRQIVRTAHGVTRMNISKGPFQKVRVPVPPRPLQLAIAEVLDRLENLQADLAAELKAEQEFRAKQYTHYREALLTFGEDDVRWATLGELATIGTGSHNTSDGQPAGTYPFYVRSQVPRYMDVYDFDETAILTSGDGVGVGKVFHYVAGKYALHQRAYRIHITAEELDSKFFFHFMRHGFLRYMEMAAVRSSVTSVRRPMLTNFPVPVPPLDEQRRIAGTLDAFDSLAADLLAALPEESTSRRTQFEYFRDQLCRFPEKIA